MTGSLVEPRAEPDEIDVLRAARDRIVVLEARVRELEAQLEGEES